MTPPAWLCRSEVWPWEGPSGSDWWGGRCWCRCSTAYPSPWGQGSSRCPSRPAHSRGVRPGLGRGAGRRSWQPVALRSVPQLEAPSLRRRSGWA
jgi:hypothetical protein